MHCGLCLSGSEEELSESSVVYEGCTSIWDGNSRLRKHALDETDAVCFVGQARKRSLEVNVKSKAIYVQLAYHVFLLVYAWSAD